jgi:tRNA-dihydrouridine synthase 1
MSGDRDRGKIKKKEKKRKRCRDSDTDGNGTADATTGAGDDVLLQVNHGEQVQHQPHEQQQPQHPNYRYILAPMVGASELPFRFLCRKYGTQLCYTPMMSSQLFASSRDYRTQYFGAPTTCIETTASATVEETTVQIPTALVVHYADHPLYAHVYANTVTDFVAAAHQAVQMQCDGLDLNLGCPQRTAYIGQYGSYMCTEKSQTHIHVATMITAAVQAIHNMIPITAKIRLLHPTNVQPTIELCRTIQQQHPPRQQQPYGQSGVSLIAIHARPRASWERTGPSARDGPANLQQVADIVHANRQNNNNNNNNSSNKGNNIALRIVTNGNTTTYSDVVQNLQFTQADGIMSAEGLLDNPALYLPRYSHCNGNGERLTEENDTTGIYVNVWTLKEEYRYKYVNYKTQKYMECNAVAPTPAPAISASTKNNDDNQIKIQQYQQKIRKVEQKLSQANDSSNHQAIEKIQTKQTQYKQKISKLHKKITKLQTESKPQSSVNENSLTIIDELTTIHSHRSNDFDTDQHIEPRLVSLRSLNDTANDKVLLAMEYLDWATIYTTTIRTIVFHVRRMCKSELVQYQLLQPCLLATTITTVRDLLDKILQYRIHPETFVYDTQRAQEEKDVLARQRYEEGKRKAYEDRMIRKAKREKKDDLFHYLNIGAQLPTSVQMGRYRKMDREALAPLWKQNHSQHCMSYHLDPNQCIRGRACAFLHVDNNTSSQLQEKEECAG